MDESPILPPIRTGPIVRREPTISLEEALKRMSETTDETDTDEVWREVFRSIDEGRPHRKLFEGMY